MEKKNNKSKELPFDLRKKAEEKVTKPSGAADAGQDDIQEYLHELMVYQTELEMQNEELKRSRFDVESSRKQYQELYEFSPIPLLTMDMDRTIREANTASVKLLKTDKKQLVGAKFHTFIHPESQDIFYFYFKELLTSNVERSCDLKLNLNNGDPCFIQFQSIISQNAVETKKIIVSALIDITDRKQTELELERCVRTRVQELLETNQRMKTEITRRMETEKELEKELSFRKIIEDTAPSGIFAVDPDGRIVYTNRAFCKMLGYTDSEILDQTPPYSFWAPEKYESNIEIFTKHMQKRASHSEGDEMTFLKKDGEILYGLVFSNAYDVDNEKTIERFWSVTNIDARKKIEIELKTSEAKRRLLSEKIIDAQEAERKRISRELHDSIGAGLTAVKFEIEKKLNQSGQINIEDFRTIIPKLQNIAEETQRISRNLHPSILDDLGLMAAIRSFCRQFKEVYSHIEIDQQLELDESNIPETLKILIFRIVQESLNNIAKHSNADFVALSLSQTADALALFIEDNGCGFSKDDVFDSKKDYRGLGIESMKERTHLSGGEFRIDSTVGEGVRIHAAWRLSAIIS